MGVIQTNTNGAISAGACAAGDADLCKYVVPMAPATAPLGQLPPNGMPSAVPVIRVKDLGHKNVKGVTPRHARFSVESFIDARSLTKVEGLPTTRNRDDVRQFFYHQSRDGHWNQEIATAAPTLSPELRAEINDRMAAQDVVRYMTWTPAGPNDGFKRLNAIGYFLAVAAAHRNDKNPTPEVLAARAVRDAVLREMVRAGGVDGRGKTRVSPAAAEAFLNNRGQRLADSTVGWEGELKELRAQGWFKAWPVLAKGGVLADNDPIPLQRTTPDHDHHAANGPGIGVTSDVHAQAVRAAAIADREARFRDQQAAIITKIRLAARRAVNGVDSTGGPFSLSV